MKKLSLRVLLMVCLGLVTVRAEAQEGGADPAPEPEEGPVEPSPEPSEAKGGEEKGEEEGESIVVTGSRLRTSRLESTADVRIVDEFRLQLPGTNTVFDAATDVSGVSLNLRQEGSSFADMEVRGLGSNATSGGHVLVLLDGIPQRRLSFGGPYLGVLPYDAIYRVELAKGATASLYGRNALTGALQLFSDPGSAQLRSRFVVDHEELSQRTRVSARVSGPLAIGAGEGGTFSLTGSMVDAAGWQPNTELNRGDLYLHMEVPLSERDRLTLLGGYLATRENIAAPVLLTDAGERLPGLDREANLSIPGLNRFDIIEERLAVRYERDWAEALTSRATVSYWSGLTVSEVARPSERPAMGTQVDRLARSQVLDEDHLFSELELFGSYTIVPALKGRYSVGASAERMSFTLLQRNLTTAAQLDATGGYNGGVPVDYLTGEEAPSSEWRYSDQTRRDTEETVYGVFLRKRFTLWERAVLEGGLRFDQYERVQRSPATGEEAKTDGSAISPAVGANVAVYKGEANRLHLFANWGRGFSPVFRAIANTEFADVDPERSTSLDLGVKAQLWDDRIDVTATVYQLDREDLVVLDAQSGMQRNAGDWQIRGIELDLRAQVVPGLELVGGYALRESEILKDASNPLLEGNQFAGFAPQTFSGGVDWLSLWGVGVGTRVRYVDERYGNNEHTFVLPSYVLWDAYASYKPVTWLNVSLYGRNLLDSDYFPSVFNGVKTGSAFAGKPRSFGLNLTAEL